MIPDRRLLVLLPGWRCREFATSDDSTMNVEDFKRLSKHLNYSRFYKLRHTHPESIPGR